MVVRFSAVAGAEGTYARGAEGTYLGCGRYLSRGTEGTYSREVELRRCGGLGVRPDTANQLGERLLGSA